MAVNRLTGMFSGMDTDTLVKALVSSQQSKIDLLVQKKQKAEWKISAYNDFNTKLKAFRENFGSALGAQSLVSKATYNDFNVSMPENNSLKVVGTVTASAGSYNVAIKQVATASTAKSDKLTVSTGGLNSTALSKTSIGQLDQLGRGAFVTGDSEFNFSINGVSFNFSTDDTLQAVMDKVNNSSAGVTMSYSQVDDKITISSKQLGEYKGLQDPGPSPEAVGSFGATKPREEDYTTAAEYEKDLKTYEESYAAFRDEVLAQNQEEIKAWKTANEAYLADQKKNISIEDTSGFLSHLGIGSVAKGQDAQVTINGESMTFSENTVTLDGVQMTFMRPTETAGINFDLTRSTDKAVDAIKKFVEDFNTLVSDLFTASTQKVSKDYNPLTDAMKEEMSEAEIEAWEAKAKEGLLYRDANMEKLYNSLRSMLNKSFGDIGRLSALGIKTSAYSPGSAFQLEIDEDKLRAALEKDTNGVYEFFSSSTRDGGEGGFITQVNSLMDNFSSSTKTREISNLNNNITSYTKSITEQEDKLAVMSEKYYLQYAKLETALGEMQTQQDSLASLLGTGSSG